MKGRGMAKASILMVDDNPVNLVVLRALLGKEGYELIAADSGQAALDLVRSNPHFDLILLDVSMPDLNGITVCRSLKEDPITSHIPIVLVSAVRTDSESITAGNEAGADGYLTKPIDDVAIRAWVEAAVRINQVYRDIQEEAEGDKAHCDDLRAEVGNMKNVLKRPLQALYAKADMLLHQVPEDSSARQEARDIKTHIENIARTVSRISGFASHS